MYFHIISPHVIAKFLNVYKYIDNTIKVFWGFLHLEQITIIAKMLAIVWETVGQSEPDVLQYQKYCVWLKAKSTPAHPSLQNSSAPEASYCTKSISNQIS